MENNIIEFVTVLHAEGQAESESIKELNELQLALVGGGMAEVVGG